MFLKIISLMFCFLDGKCLIINSKSSLKEELARRVDCWLWGGENCPQDGEWSDWEEWRDCSGECGQVGLRKRVRRCDNPIPTNGGNTCYGQSHQEVECRMPGCSEKDYEEMLQGDAHRMRELEIIRKAHLVYPSLIDRCLEAECHLSIVKNILLENADRYWNALHCVKHNSGCPVAGGWSNWGKWTECSAMCGKGSQIRCRTCDSPLATYTKLACKGENCTSRPCQGSYCQNNIGQTSGSWSSWTEWSRCSTSCGPGLSKRTRECLENVSTTFTSGNQLLSEPGIEIEFSSEESVTELSALNSGESAELSTELYCDMSSKSDIGLFLETDFELFSDSCNEVSSEPNTETITDLNKVITSESFSKSTEFPFESVIEFSSKSTGEYSLEKYNVLSSESYNKQESEIELASESTRGYSFELDYELPSESYDTISAKSESYSEPPSFNKVFLESNIQFPSDSYSEVSFEPDYELPPDTDGVFVQSDSGPLQEPQNMDIFQPYIDDSSDSEGEVHFVPDKENRSFLFSADPFELDHGLCPDSYYGVTSQFDESIPRVYSYSNFPISSYVQKRSKRSNEEYTLCKGPHTELKPCFIKHCHVDGGWSEWEPWSQCSIACGLGVQSRSRACSAPPPSHGGSHCQGPVTHFKHCFLEPCAVNSHEVASFTGDGFLKYSDMGRNTRLLHILIRFMPLGQNGNLILRIPNEDYSNYVLLSLAAGYLVFAASIENCKVSLVNFQTMELGKWTKVLIKVTPSGVSMRINDKEKYLKNVFSCKPKLPNFRSKMVVGLNFTGQIERLYVNFLKRHLQLAPNEVLNPTNLYPSSNDNVEYELTEIDETFRSLDELFLIPCSQNDNLVVEIVVKGYSQDGVLMFMTNKRKEKSLILSVEPRRVQLHFVFLGGFIECFEVVEPHVGHWIHIRIDYDSDKTWGLSVDGGKRRSIRKYDFDNTIECSEFILVGDVASTVHAHLGENVIKGLNNESLDGVLGYVELNGNILDINSLDGKLEKGQEIFSSEAVSTSLIYKEIKLEPDEQLEISCVYKESNKNIKMTHEDGSKPVWVKFDVPLMEENFESIGINYSIEDDFAIMTLKTYNYSSQEAIEGFYSCWLPTPPTNSGNLLITYGVTVLNPSYEFSNIFRSIPNIAPILFLIFFLLVTIWLLLEYVMGMKSGWGLFSSKGIKKRIKKTELCDLSHSSESSTLLGINNKYYRNIMKDSRANSPPSKVVS